jgi:hypothetical protein
LVAGSKFDQVVENNLVALRPEIHFTIAANAGVRLVQ